MAYYEIFIDKESAKEAWRPIIKALVVMLSDKELGELLDKDAMIESTLDQIVNTLEKSEAIQIK